MAYLDFYLKDDGRIEYNKNLSINQYSNKVDTIRLLSKITYDIVNMNVTLPNNIQTTKKILIKQPSKENEYWVYSYSVDLSITDIEIAADKAIIKISFFMYPDSEDQSIVNTSGICYIPIMRNTENAKPDGSVTETDLNTILSEINSINEKIYNLNLGEIDTAKNYNTNIGNIKEKFDLVDNSISVLDYKVNESKSSINTINESITSINNRVNFLENNSASNGDLLELSNYVNSIKSKTDELETNINKNKSDITDIKSNISSLPLLSDKVNSLETRIDTNANGINENKSAIEEIKNDIIPTLQAGLKYEIVEALPNLPSSGVVYLIKNTASLENENEYTEYLYINNKWEVIGITNHEVNLENYYTKDEVDNSLNSYYTKEDVDVYLGNYYTKTETNNTFVKNSSLSNYYTKTESDNKFLTSTDLSNYYTSSEVDNKFALKNALPTKISELTNDSGFIKNENGAFNYEYLSNKPAIPSSTSELLNDSGFITSTSLNSTLSSYATKNELNTTKSELENRISSNESSINGINTNIENIETTMSETNSTANKALVLAQAKQYSKVFETKADMISYIQVKQEDPLTIGTELFIKDSNVSDYWISAVYDESTSYTTKFGEVFENVYYGVEESESKIDLSSYATIEYVNGDYTTNIKSYIDNQDALKVDLSEKSSLIDNTSTDNQWASALAVKNYVDLSSTNLQNNIDDNSNKITVIESNISSINSTISSNKEELDNKDSEIDQRLDEHDSAISTLTTNLSNETSSREQSDTNLQNSINNLSNSLNSYKTEVSEAIESAKSEASTALNSYKEEANNKFLEYTETISKAESIVDYNDSTKNLKFTSDSDTTNFTISSLDISAIQEMLSMFGPNEYN